MAKTPRKRRTSRKPANPRIARHREGRAIGRARAKRRALGTPPPPPSVDPDGEAAGEPRRVRLNKLLADHGIASRRKCDELIAKGKVSIDGEPVTELGTKVDPDAQTVEVDGVTLRGMPRRYYLLNKPGGVVCTNEERELRPRAVDLITDKDKGRIYTVGRLDEESTGLILLTNDGDFANRVMHPRYGVHKTYSVRVAGRIDDEALNKVRDGVQLAEGRTGGARILVKRRGRDSSTLDVTLREGMNREIRRAFAGVGYKVVALRRTQIGPLTPRGLKTGHWRKLKQGEILQLLNPPEEMPAPTRPSRPGSNARGGAASKRPARTAQSAGRTATRRAGGRRDEREGASKHGSRPGRPDRRGDRSHAEHGKHAGGATRSRSAGARTGSGDRRGGTGGRGRSSTAAGKAIRGHAGRGKGGGTARRPQRGGGSAKHSSGSSRRTGGTGRSGGGGRR